jgi:hypothetical protein
MVRDAVLSFLLTVALFFLVHSFPVFAGTLSCSITTAAACTGGTNTIILRMSAATNAHAELPSQSTAGYASNVVCCNGVSGLGTSCSGTFATALHLSAVTNAHVEQNTFSQFSQNACISVSSGSVSIGYGASCSGFDTTLASTPATSNAHIGSPANYANKVCGTASVGSSLTLSVDYSAFGTIAPGLATFSTSTVSVTTSNSSGWFVTLSGDNKTASNSNLQRTGDTTVQVTDQTEWIPASATTTAGNAVRISSFTNSGNVLAFRVMTASGTIPFRASSWWGTTDAYADSATSLWAGISSSTAANLKIGNSNVTSGGSPVLSTVLYYLKTSSGQKTGAYTAPITYTATVNP